MRLHHQTYAFILLFIYSFAFQVPCFADQKNPSIQGSPSKQGYKPPKGTPIKDLSKKGIIHMEGRQRCGSYFFQLQVDRSGQDFHPDFPHEYLMITDDKGVNFNSPTRYYGDIDEVACVDLTGNGNPELFFQFYSGGNTGSSFSGYAYLLENPIKLIFENHYLTYEFIDLNGDGIQEIISGYSFRFFGDLCGACSPDIEQIFCYQNGEYSDCSSRFPKFLIWQIAKSKEELTNELKKYSSYSTNTSEKEISLINLKPRAVEILAYSMLLDKEEQALDYLSEVLPTTAFHWLDERRIEVRENLNLRIPFETYLMETPRFVEAVLGHFSPKIVSKRLLASFFVAFLIWVICIGAIPFIRRKIESGKIIFSSLVGMVCGCVGIFLSYTIKPLPPEEVTAQALILGLIWFCIGFLLGVYCKRGGRIRGEKRDETNGAGDYEQEVENETPMNAFNASYLGIAIMVFYGLWELSGVSLFLIGFFLYSPHPPDYHWAVMLGGVSMLTLEFLRICYGLHPITFLILPIILGIIIDPWYIGVFWVYAILHIFESPVSLNKVINPSLVIELNKAKM